MLTQAPKGTKDVLPQDSYAWQALEARMREAAARAGYREARTPVFEHTELFLRGVGDTTDIVQKEMYTFLDKGGRSITLKPEGTAGAVRAFVEGRLYAEALPQKLYYLNAPIFRYENPQAGRLREHHQFGMECFGGKEPTVEAELIAALYDLLYGLGITDVSASINSIGCPVCRPVYHAALKAYVGDRLSSLCKTCQERFERNPLRVLDCKAESCKAILKDAPSMLDSLCDECAAHFEGLKALLTARGIPFRVDSRIVRGLDYYTKTVFEFITSPDLPALCGGGRYDRLVEELGGPATPAAGFGIGTERLLMLLASRGIVLPKPAVCEAFVASIGEESRVSAFVLTQSLRALGVRADMDHAARSLKAQFKFADKLGARLAVLVGGDEWARGVVRVRDLTTREETEISIDQAPAHIAKRLREAEGGTHNG